MKKVTHNDILKIALANPDCTVPSLAPAKPDKTEARKQLEAEMKQQFARQFEATWRLLNGPELEKEVKIDDSRRWRGDYAVETATGKWLIELEGGVYLKSGGGHRSKGGYIDDVFKYNTASMRGFKLIRIATGMINADYLRQIVDAIKSTDAD